jgi:chorismate mutase
VTPTTGTRLIIDNVDPALLVSVNRRIHHHQRAKICAHWRGLTAS